MGGGGSGKGNEGGPGGAMGGGGFKRVDLGGGGRVQEARWGEEGGAGAGGQGCVPGPAEAAPRGISPTERTAHWDEEDGLLIGRWTGTTKKKVWKTWQHRARGCTALPPPPPPRAPAAHRTRPHAATRPQPAAAGASSAAPPAARSRPSVSSPPTSSALPWDADRAHRGRGTQRRARATGRRHPARPTEGGGGAPVQRRPLFCRSALWVPRGACTSACGVAVPLSTGALTKARPPCRACGGQPQGSFSRGGWVGLAPPPPPPLPVVLSF